MMYILCADICELMFKYILVYFKRIGFNPNVISMYFPPSQSISCFEKVVLVVPLLDESTMNHTLIHIGIGDSIRNTT